MSSVSSSDVVLLDVGGTRFYTTVGTLTKFSSSFFGSLFSGKYPLTKHSDNTAAYYVFIDRDGTHFLKILNFLRSGRIIMPADLNARKELLIEAEFYCLKDHVVRAWVRDLYQLVPMPTTVSKDHVHTCPTA
jgi:BTB/POZ domain-containing adapter for CUL3-mediated RhoA degradation protein